MIPQVPWVERKFNFDFPAGIYSCLLERLRGTPARVEEMVRDSRRKTLRRKTDGKWSVMEQIGHLIDLEELHEQRLNDFVLGREKLSAWDVTNAKTTSGGHNKKRLRKLLKDLRKTRAHFIRQLEKANDELISRTSIHPRLNVPMRLVDMVYFVCEHDDHHLAKMRELLADE